MAPVDAMSAIAIEPGFNVMSSMIKINGAGFYEPTMLQIQLVVKDIKFKL